MLKKIVFSVVFITMIAFVTSLAFGANYNITISGPPWQIAPCPVPGVATDTLTFTNNSAIPIVVKVWNKNTGVVTSYPIAATEDTVHTIAAGDCEVKVFDTEDPPKELVECMTAQCQVPTLTQWGIIGLVALILVSTIFIMLRRKRAVVSA